MLLQNTINEKGYLKKQCKSIASGTHRKTPTFATIFEDFVGLIEDY